MVVFPQLTEQCSWVKVKGYLELLGNWIPSVFFESIRLSICFCGARNGVKSLEIMNINLLSLAKECILSTNQTLTDRPPSSVTLVQPHRQVWSGNSLPEHQIQTSRSPDHRDLVSNIPRVDMFYIPYVYFFRRQVTC